MPVGNLTSWFSSTLQLTCLPVSVRALVLLIFAPREKIGNFRLEPPGLFRGRGDHPKQGRLKVGLRGGLLVDSLSVYLVCLVSMDLYGFSIYYGDCISAVVYYCTTVMSN